MGDSRARSSDEFDFMAEVAPVHRWWRAVRGLCRIAERQTRDPEELPDRLLAVRRLSEFPGKPGNAARRIDIPPKRTDTPRTLNKAPPPISGVARTATVATMKPSTPPWYASS